MIYREESGEKSRIRLRAIDREDILQMTSWINDPEVRLGISLFLPISRFEEEKWFENMMESPASEHPLMIEVNTSEGWKTVGDCGVFNIDWRNRSCELGILIGEKKFWNQGYGTETMKLLLEHCFETLNIHRVFLRVFESNPRAIRAYEKAGFVHEGRQRQAEYHSGRYWDVLFMSVLRNEWKTEAESS